MSQNRSVNSAEYPFQVRKAKPEDAAELARLRWEFRVEEESSQARQEFLQACEGWLRSAMRSGRWVIAVAGAQDGSLCGCMYLQCVEKAIS